MAAQTTEVALQLHWPENRLPAAVLLDDPTPCRNPAWYEHPEEGHVAEIPNSFVERFAEICARTGASGKFSVVPCPGAQGRIDEGMPGVDAAEMDEFLRLVRERIAPRWDICPELLTHNRALDLATMRPLPLKEDAWVAQQDEQTLAAYIARALEILRNVGLAPNGVTSPWATGRTVEDRYAAAIATALREVCDVRLGWYFLHVDQESPTIDPRLMELDARAGTALVSIVSGSMDAPAAYDFAWRTQMGEPATLDPALSADGQTGRLADLFRNGSPITFHTHWQSLFSNGTGAGLDAFDELCTRVNNAFGHQVRWSTARELAVAAAARAATRALATADGVTTLQAPFGCPAFTFSMPRPAHGAALLSDGAPLELDRAAAGPMQRGTWRAEGAAARVCVDLRDGLALSWAARG